MKLPSPCGFSPLQPVDTAPIFKQGVLVVGLRARRQSFRYNEGNLAIQVSIDFRTSLSGSFNSILSRQQVGNILFRLCREFLASKSTLMNSIISRRRGIGGSGDYLPGDHDDYPFFVDDDIEDFILLLNELHRSHR